MAVDYIAFASDEVPNMGGELADPYSIAGGACCQTARVVAVDVGILVVSKSVNFVRVVLGDASS